MNVSERTEKLRAIRDRVWNLTESPLYAYRKKNNYYPVLGEGSHTAQIMFIGEAPGETEAKTGRPFCGAAGKFLDELLESIHLQRKDVYITNIIKDRPPQNRDPLPAEIAIYSQFLNEQIQIIQPKVLVTLGRYSMQYILEKYHLSEKNQTISKLHGHLIKTKADYGDILILPLYHPAVALYNVQSRKILFNDIRQLLAIYSSL